MNRPAKKKTLWTLRKVSTRISLSMPCMLTRIDTFRLLWIFVSGIITLYLYPPETVHVSARISLRGLRRPIWVDTLRRGHNVGFLAGRLNSFDSIRNLLGECLSQIGV